MTDNDLAEQVRAIQERLAELAQDPHQPGTPQELGAIRAQLRMLAAENAQIGARLSEALGLDRA